MTTINLDGVIGWDITANDFNSDLDKITGDITLELNSGGGYITEGVSILNKIRAYDRGEITAKVSYAASMMTQIALACDKVKVYDNAIFMIHNAQGFAIGDHNEMRTQGDLLERMSGMLAKIYTKKTKKDESEIKKMMDDETYLFGEEIVDQGFADEVINTDNLTEKDEAITMADINIENVYRAMKEEGLSTNDLKTAFKSCIGNCDMGGDTTTAIPTASSDKLAKNSKIGVTMEFNEENFKILVENKATLENRAEALQVQLDTANTALENKNDEIMAIESKLSEVEGEATAYKNLVEARVKEAVASNVTDVSVVLDMINADSDEKASELAIESKSNTKALNQGEGDSIKSLWDEFK